MRQCGFCSAHVLNVTGTVLSEGTCSRPAHAIASKSLPSDLALHVHRACTRVKDIHQTNLKIRGWWTVLRRTVQYSVQQINDRDAVRNVCMIAVLLWPMTVSARAQVDEPVACSDACAPASPSASAPTELQPPGDEPSARDIAPTDTPDTHILGVIPNYLTVEGTEVAPITAGRKFKLVALDSFDLFMYPYVGGVALLTHNYGPGVSGFGKQYMASMADNTLGNFMTSAVLPSLLHQDPRYFQRGSGGFLSRVVYAASRNLVTRSDSGHTQFNTSEIAGNAIAGSAASLYYPRTQRTASAMLTRWGMQMAWDTLSNEMKEFWPDVRHKLHGK